MASYLTTGTQFNYVSKVTPGIHEGGQDFVAKTFVRPTDLTYVAGQSELIDVGRIFHNMNALATYVVSTGLVFKTNIGGYEISKTPASFTVYDVYGSAATNNITVTGLGNITFNGSPTVTLNSNYGNVTFTNSSGSNWVTSYNSSTGTTVTSLNGLFGVIQVSGQNVQTVGQVISIGVGPTGTLTSPTSTTNNALATWSGIAGAGLLNTSVTALGGTLNAAVLSGTTISGNVVNAQVSFTTPMSTVTSEIVTNFTGTNISGTTGVLSTLNAFTSATSPLITTTNFTGTNISGTTAVVSTLSAFTSLTSPLATITIFNATNITGTNISGTTGVLSTLNAFTSLTSPMATLTSISATNVTGTNISGTTGVLSTLNAFTSITSPLVTATNFTGTTISGTTASLNALNVVTETVATSILPVTSGIGVLGSIAKPFSGTYSNAFYSSTRNVSGSNYTALMTDSVLFTAQTSGIVIGFNPYVAGQEYIVINTLSSATNSVTLSGIGCTIDGAATKVMSNAATGTSSILISNGSNYFTLNNLV